MIDLDSWVFNKDKRDEKLGESRYWEMPIKAVFSLLEMGNIHAMNIHTSQRSLDHGSPQAFSLPWSWASQRDTWSSMGCISVLKMFPR